MNLPIHCSRGGEGTLDAFANDVLSLTLSESHPPGAPVVVTIRYADAVVAVSAKIVGGRKLPEGGFALRARVGSLAATTRSQITSWLDG